MVSIVLVLLSSLFGVLGIIILQRFDIHEKEPFMKMFYVALWGGIVSVFVSLLIYEFHIFQHMLQRPNGVAAMAIVGPVEEFAKLLALYSCYFMIRDEMDEPLDGIIYMSCVALGFSLIENYFYASQGHQHQLIVVRLLVATPAHLLFSALMGLAFYERKKRKAGIKPLLIAWIVSSVLHGLYDLIIFEKLGIIVLIFLFIYMRRIIVELLNYTRAKSPFRSSLVAFVLNTEPETSDKTIACTRCNSGIGNKQWKLQKIRIQQCDTCGAYISTLETLVHIFAFFGSTLLIYRTAARKTKEGTITLVGGNTVDRHRKLAYFDIWDLHSVTEQLNQRQIDHFEKQNIFRFILAPRKRKKFESI